MDGSDCIATAGLPQKAKKGQYGLGHVYVHRRNWWLDVRVNGERYTRKLGPEKVLEKREARAIANERINKILNPDPPAPVVKGQMPFREYAEKFATHYTKTSPRKSGLKYKDRPIEDTPLRHAVRFFGEKPLREINTAAVEEFRAYVMGRKVGKYMQRHLTITTANKNISLLRALFYRAVRGGEADCNPVAELPKEEKMRKETPKAGRIMQPDEQAKLLERLPV